MIVDDESDLEQIIRQKFRRQIREQTYEFVFASNGQEALELIDNHKDIDVVFSDINMPVMDGYETTEWLKKNYPDIKVLALSMFEDDQAGFRRFFLDGRKHDLDDATIERIINAFPHDEQPQIRGMLADRKSTRLNSSHT